MSYLDVFGYRDNRPKTKKDRSPHKREPLVQILDSRGSDVLSCTFTPAEAEKLAYSILRAAEQAANQRAFTDYNDRLFEENLDD